MASAHPKGVGREWRKGRRRSFDDVGGARFRPSDIPELRGFRVRMPKSIVRAPTDPVRELHDRPTRPVSIPYVVRATREIRPSRVEQPRAAMKDVVARPPGERVTVPILVNVPAFARRSIEPQRPSIHSRRTSIPRAAAPVTARPSHPRALLFAIGLAAGIALGWAAQSFRHVAGVATHAVLR